MNNSVEWLQQHLMEIYDRNPYVKLLEMQIVSIAEGHVQLNMPVKADKHANLYGAAHGGALASLADTVMGVACASCGKRVVTIEMNINYIKGVAAGTTVLADAKVIHNGRQTIVVEADICDSQGKLAAKSRGTFCVIGRFENE